MRWRAVARSQRRYSKDEADGLGALVLASLMEMSLRQALPLSFGSPLIFVQRPVSVVLLVLVILALLLPFIAARRRRLRQS
jgi:putative tricarboxylic transport membrane protein